MLKNEFSAFCYKAVRKPYKRTVLILHKKTGIYLTVTIRNSVNIIVQFTKFKGVRSLNLNQFSIKNQWNSQVVQFIYFAISSNIEESLIKKRITLQAQDPIPTHAHRKQSSPTTCSFHIRTLQSSSSVIW